MNTQTAQRGGQFFFLSGLLSFGLTLVVGHHVVFTFLVLGRQTYFILFPDLGKSFIQQRRLSR